jgi:predicted Zn-dependent protease
MTSTDQSHTTPRHRAPSRLLAAVTAVALVTGQVSAPAQTPGGGPPIIRDAEIEQLLRDYVQPILQAAGLAKQNIQVVIINDRGFNAFVADGRRIFINAGALMEAETPNEVIGVLAHETGHIAGGHLVRLREQIAAASTQSIIALLLGVGALIAASRSSGNASNNMGQAGAAAISGPQAAIQNQLLSYVRTQEDAADRAGVRFLTASGQSAKGMSDTFRRLADRMLYSTRYLDPYLQSHPLPTERVSGLQELARSSPHWDKKDSAALQQRHDLMRGKLYGFIDRFDAVGRRFPLTDNSMSARYARAIAAYRSADGHGSLAQIDALIQMQPQNPYFHELKGQALLESGKAAEAVAPLRKAVSLAPNPALIQVMLAQALLAASERNNADEALTLLQAALAREPESADAYAQIAMAYSRKGDLARADLASAQSAYMRGDLRTARQLAARAKTRFPVGSPGWVKADDIATYKPPTNALRQ